MRYRTGDATSANSNERQWAKRILSFIRLILGSFPLFVELIYGSIVVVVIVAAGNFKNDESTVTKEQADLAR